MNRFQKFIAWFLIPRGFYCDGCPFWFLDKTLPYQENGYCSYLKQNDWVNNERAGMLEGCYGDGRPAPPVSAHKIRMSLLWDGCKECRIKID